MAVVTRKPNTTEVKIAQEFRAWVRRNPDAPKSRRMLAFDRIADKHQKSKVAA